MHNPKRNIIISGLTAAGKTTHAKLLCQEFKLRYVSASQILLRLAGLRADLPPDFWVTREGRAVSDRVSWQQIDDEFRAVEAKARCTVFDCQSLPWLCSTDCMSIWIGSSLQSRIMKAMISHRNTSRLTPSQVAEGLAAKDLHARDQIFRNYGVNLFSNRAPFRLIVDISSFIEAPTEAAARVSIARAHAIISSAVGCYLYNSSVYSREFRRQLVLNEDVIVQSLSEINLSDADPPLGQDEP
jgi:cytidylate kinase